MYKILHAGLGLVLAAGAATTGRAAYSLTNPVPAEQLRDLSTDRPDQTESPHTVDAGHWQIELDFVHYTRDRDGALRREDLSVAPLNLKFGLSQQMDMQLMVDPHVHIRTEDRITGVVTEASGFGDVTLRLKYNFWGNDGGRTAFAVMPFVKWPLSASDVRNGQTEGGVIFILGYELPAGWTSAVMTEIDFVADGAGGREAEWVNTITFAHDLTERLGGYVELVAVTGTAPGFKWQGQFDAGLTYAVNANTQLDLGCNFGITRLAPDYQPFVGLSRRF